uniref:Uncharacterized protein n=1 Tax=Fagus sylvatica TaxID=28930 RepID=A0A2N9IPL3_FAGSY
MNHAPSISIETHLENQLNEAGSDLLNLPSSIDELLTLLDKVHNLLANVEQAPSKSIQDALLPSMKALISNELLRHAEIDVKVSVVSCITEIMRITAPDVPYDDEKMKEIFQLTVAAFENLSHVSSRYYTKAIFILDTIAKVKSCLVMLDLECDALVVKMFQTFLKIIRSNHSPIVFSAMETIMTMVIDESDDISLALLSPLLASVQQENETVSPISWKLGKKVVTNCAVKLQPYLQETVCSIGVASDTFCTTKVGQAVDATFKLVEDSIILEEDQVVSFSSPIPHIEFIIPDKFNDVMESKAPLFSVLPTVVPEMKQVFRVRLLLLQHYKTRDAVDFLFDIRLIVQIFKCDELIFCSFVLSLADLDAHLMMEDGSLVWTSNDVVIVLEHQNEKIPLSYVSETERRHVVPSQAQRHILAGLASVVGGLSAPYEKASHVHERPVVNWLWATGCHPFGPFSNTSLISQMLQDVALRNTIYARVDSALRRIRDTSEAAWLVAPYLLMLAPRVSSIIGIRAKYLNRVTLPLLPARCFGYLGGLEIFTSVDEGSVFLGRSQVPEQGHASPPSCQMLRLPGWTGNFHFGG